MEGESNLQPRELNNLAPIPPEEQEKRGWKLNLNGDPDNVNWFTLDNPKMNVHLEYGKTAGGYDSFSIEEEGGGGVITLPYVEVDGELYVGLLEEDRPNQGGKIYNAPRGFLDPNETHFEAASRELMEETGYIAADKRVLPFLGENVNPNSTFFVTKGKDKGVKPFKLHIDKREVKQIINSKNKEDCEFAFDTNILKPTSKIAEKIVQCKFVHWTKPTMLQDGMTRSAMARFIPEEVIPRIEKKKERGRLVSVLKKIIHRKS